MLNIHGNPVNFLYFSDTLIKYIQNCNIKLNKVGVKEMAGELIPEQIFILIIAVLAVVALVIVVGHWKNVKKSSNMVKLIEKEIELKKVSMVEKDIETKRLMENRIALPKEQEDKLLNIRNSTTDILGDVGYLHNEVNERLSRLEAQAEQKKLEKILKNIEKKEKELLKHKI
jgi:hypothetical protein